MAGDGKTSPRASLGTWPTPLEPMPRLAQALGLGPGDLWVKRDDLSGVGGGGNKLRKLEWTAGAALAEGATTLITSGAAQSNHARLTAATGARLGLDVVLVLAGTAAGSASGNLALDGLLGARIIWAGDADDERLAVLADAAAAQERARGAVPVVIPFGGSSVTGARGYVECARELLTQAPDLTTVVCAVGSGGTMAGLVARLGTDRVLGVDCGALSDPGAAVAGLASGLSDEPVSTESLRLDRDQIGAGYAALTDGVRSALTLSARTEGIILDPIYTGRAMAGLIAAAGSGELRPGQRTVFLHSGGLPGFFGHAETVAWAESQARADD